LEATLLILLSIPYLIIKYLVTDHDTPPKKTPNATRRDYAGNDPAVRSGLQYFTQVLLEKPNCALAYVYRGKCNLKLDNLYSAVFDCTRAASLDGTLAEAT
jgi:hypothetical protein